MYQLLSDESRFCRTFHGAVPFFFMVLAIELATPIHSYCQTSQERFKTTTRPNIILFVTDDLSPDLGCYGNSAIQTPHLDALASEGVRFTHAFCTTASCSASRSVILTGLF
ncbi:MAG: sulfatase-like hydrolase/transferase, partial [Planctomycetota bacterium]|nr:sulfatase-like hydrolase/transferase [Planctomycetota bacterium]